MNYKGWHYIIKGEKWSDNFSVDIGIDHLICINLGKQLAQIEYQSIAQQELEAMNRNPYSFLNYLDKEYKSPEQIKEELTSKWFGKLMDIRFKLNYNEPSGLFSQYDEREKKVEVNVKHYIDTQLGDLQTWLKRNWGKLISEKANKRKSYI